MSTQEKQFEELLKSDSIDDDFINEIVENKLRVTSSDFKVILVIVTPATKPNENYLGVVCRVKIKIQIRDTNEFKLIDVIVKVSQESSSALNEFNVYLREKFVYENVLNSYEEMLFDKTTENIRFGPKILGFKYEPRPIIALEDLKVEGYNMIDRKDGLSLELSKCFLSKLAKFHAVGAVKFQKEGTLHDCLDRNSSIAPKPDSSSPLSLTFIRIHEEFVRALRNYGDCDIYADKIEKWNKELVATGYLYENKKMTCGLQTLNHGDVWVNNMMFKFDPNEVLMIDYQLCFWGSPCYDFLSFLSASVQDDTKVKYFDELIEFYYHEFNESLKKLEYSSYIPSFEDFKEDVMDKGYILAGFLPFLFFVKYSSKVEFSFESLMVETDETVLREIYDRLFNDEYFIKAVKIWLPFLSERGFIDTLILPE